MDNYKGFEYEIVPDCCPESPVEWDLVGKFIFFGRYRSVGNEHNLNEKDYSGWEELEMAVVRQFKPKAMLPVYGYSHGGLTISNSRGGQFSDRWDSGQLGWVIATSKSIKETQGWKRVTKKRHADLIERLKEDTALLDEFFTGDVYEIKWAEPIDETTGGYFGYDYAEQEAQRVINWFIMCHPEYVEMVAA